MTPQEYQEYQEKIRIIGEILHDISEITKSQAFAQNADMSNPCFKNLMAQHAKLTKIAATINDDMLNKILNRT